MYPDADDENKVLYSLLRGGFANPGVESKIKPIITSLHPDPRTGEDKWAEWKQSKSMRKFFPKVNDTYVDGGAIDNTPYTAAVDFVRDSLQMTGGSVRDEMLELYVIYLSTEPKVELDETTDPFIFEVVGRTLALVNAAGESSNATTFDTINTFGKRGEQIAKVLDLVLDSYKETLIDLDVARRSHAEEKLLARMRELGKRSFPAKTPDGILDQIRKWTDETFTNRLPLHVETVKIYPQKMPLSTLQFTERLGYKKENAIQMLTMGCYNTLDSLRTRLESRVKAGGWESLDRHDQRALTLARKWTGDLWQPPPGAEATNKERTSWQCQWTTCAFHAHACPHGVRAQLPAA
jgi:hypothetical protein